MSGRKSKSKGKILTAAVKRDIAKARKDLADGKGLALGEVLKKVLERDARKHAA